MILQKQIKEITERKASNYKPERIIPFGFYAYGVLAKDSDLDLLLNKRKGSLWLLMK